MTKRPLVSAELRNIRGTALSISMSSEAHRAAVTISSASDGHSAAFVGFLSMLKKVPGEMLNLDTLSISESSFRACLFFFDG